MTQINPNILSQEDIQRIESEFTCSNCDNFDVCPNYEDDDSYSDTNEDFDYTETIDQ